MEGRIELKGIQELLREQEELRKRRDELSEDKRSSSLSYAIKPLKRKRFPTKIHRKCTICRIESSIEWRRGPDGLSSYLAKVHLMINHIDCAMLVAFGMLISFQKNAKSEKLM